MAWFGRKTHENGGPTEDDILRHTTYLQWRSSTKIRDLVNETRAKIRLLPYGFNQGTYYHNLRNLVAQGLLIAKDGTDMTDEEIATTDDETIDSREKIEALLKQRSGISGLLRPTRIYKKNASGIMTKADEPLIVLPDQELATT